MSPTVFQIVSNLHLETQGSYEYNFKQTAPNLALLGDIGQVAHDALFAFLEKQLTRYWNVSSSWETTSQSRAVGPPPDKESASRFIFLDQTRYDINTILTVLGCTLFSRVTQDQAAAVAGRLIDFRQILNWTVEDHVDAHLSDLRWLNTQVAQISQTQPQRQIVIFTHHSPTTDERATDIRHKGSPVASGFATNLGLEECWTNPSVVMWAFGHTHFSCNFVDERGKRVVANQRGYAMAPQSAFDSEKTFVVGKETGSSMLLV